MTWSETNKLDNKAEMLDSNQGLQGGRKYVALPDTVEAALVHAHAGDHIRVAYGGSDLLPPSCAQQG